MKFPSKLPGRLLLVTVMSLAVLSVGCSTEPESKAGATQLIVYKNPQCGCCGKWVKHMQSAGFDMKVKELADVNTVKKQFAISPQHRSCHTAVSVTGDYVFEGHIPASVIEAFFAAPPADAKGLLVPGMPVGSPGMEVGNQRSAYDVLLLKVDGSTDVYTHVAGETAI